jgi:predicted amidophosphoribosyltransferase
MNIYGETFNCENCEKELTRGSAEDNMTELCNDCLEEDQESMLDTCENCGEKADTQEGVYSPCGYKMYK